MPKVNRMPRVVDLTTSSPPLIPASTVLKDAIRIADTKRLRLVLQIVCNNSEEASKLAEELLLVPEAKVSYKVAKRKNERDASKDNEDSKDNDGDESGEEDEEEDGDDEEDSQTTEEQRQHAGSSLKRLQPRFAMCENCDEEFDAETGDKNSCMWHPEDKEPDYKSEFWADHDEDCHGTIEDLSDEYPKGFIYTCCDKPGDSEGCKIGTHVEKDNGYKRLRY